MHIFPLVSRPHADSVAGSVVLDLVQILGRYQRSILHARVEVVRVVAAGLDGKLLAAVAQNLDDGRNLLGVLWEEDAARLEVAAGS